MIKQKELELLLDIQKLIKKHGEKTFTNLVKNLSNREFISSIEVLGKYASSVKPTKESSKVVVDYKDKINSVLSNIKSNDKHQLLTELMQSIDNKEFFKTLKELSDYLNETAIYQSKVKTWLHGKYILVSHFSKQRAIDIEFGIKHIVQNEGSAERSLDAWSNMILSDEKKANK